MEPISTFACCDDGVTAMDDNVVSVEVVGAGGVEVVDVVVDVSLDVQEAAPTIKMPSKTMPSQ